MMVEVQANTLEVVEGMRVAVVAVAVGVVGVIVEGWSWWSTAYMGVMVLVDGMEVMVVVVDGMEVIVAVDGWEWWWGLGWKYRWWR